MTALQILRQYRRMGADPAKPAPFSTRLWCAVSQYGYALTAPAFTSRKDAVRYAVHFYRSNPDLMTQ